MISGCPAHLSFLRQVDMTPNVSDNTSIVLVDENDHDLVSFVQKDRDRFCMDVVEVFRSCNILNATS